MALPAALQALFDRLQTYNSDAYNASTNPGGFARGGNQKPVDNFIKSVRDFTAFGKGISDMAAQAGLDAQATASDRVQTGKDRAAVTTASDATLKAFDEFNDRYLGAKASDPAKDNDGNALIIGATYFNTTANVMKVWSATGWQVFIPDAAGYYTKGQVDGLIAGIPVLPPILPITMTAPASGATDVGAGGTYTFVARAFVGDTTGFYSNYGVPVASRFVNVYEPGSANPVKTFTATGGGPSLVANFTGSGLATSKAYQFEFGYTDAQGNTVKSPKVSATTASQFKPSEGQAYQGGFLAFQNFGDGDLFDLVVAPKSTEASKQWYSQSTSTIYSPSRVNGPKNTADFNAAIGTGTAFATNYAASISIGGVAGYLGAVDELRAISSRLKPSVAVEPAFKTGGAEVFGSERHWSSTEIDASNALNFDMSAGSDGVLNGKVNSRSVRAIKRVSTFAPYPIGTAMEGGTLAAYFTDLSSGSPVTYMLIVADKATEVTRAWASVTGGGATSRTNGFQQRLSGSVNPNYPAKNYCTDLNSGGKSDWYLGAIDEMLAIARMNSQLPSGQQMVKNNTPYWSSTEVDGSSSKCFLISNTDTTLEQSGGKTSSYLVRPIRRVLLPTT